MAFINHVKQYSFSSLGSEKTQTGLGLKSTEEDDA